MKKRWKKNRKGKAGFFESLLAAIFLIAGVFAGYLYENGGGPAAAGTEKPAAESGSFTTQKESDAAETGVSGTMTVHFLDAGQGTAVLFEQDGHFMLVDGGPADASSYVVAYLKKQGVERLDYIIASHYDSDHLNGVIGALHAFGTDMLLGPDYEHDSRLYRSFVKLLREKNITPYYPAVGDTFPFGKAEFAVVCPDGYSDTDSNNNSVGIRMVFGDTSFLILGDAEEESEAQMLLNGIPVQSDVYLASHHGSSSSSSEKFLKTAAPEWCVISCGRGNSYGHPHKEVMELLQSLEIQMFRTDVQGEIVAVTDGKTITWNKEPSDDWRSGNEENE